LPLSLKPDFSTKSRFKTAPKTTVKLTDLLKVDPKKEENGSGPTQHTAQTPFTQEQLQSAWNEFAEQRKKFQAEYQLLSQPFDVKENQLIVHIHNPVQDLMLTNIKSELAAFLREKLNNHSITITGILKEVEERQVIYTNREKFDYLVARNPMLKELKDRLGLDTDF